MKTKHVWVATLTLALGCEASANEHPDMSVSGHENVAQAHAQRAEVHERNAEGFARGPNPNPETTLLAGGAACPPSEFAVCWGGGTSDVHRAEADVHRREAAAHRAASTALREAERVSCAGVAEADRDVSPFEHAADIAGVEPRADGAVITFRAVPRLTAARLQQLVDCHLARNAALGHVVPEMPTCPLVPKGVTAKVTSTTQGLSVTIRSEDAATSDEIRRRASRITAR